jgi:hypothetical protein
MFGMDWYDEMKSENPDDEEKNPSDEEKARAYFVAKENGLAGRSGSRSGPGPSSQEWNGVIRWCSRSEDGSMLLQMSNR